MNPIVFGGARGIGASIADYLYNHYETPLVVDKEVSPKYVTRRISFPYEPADADYLLGPEKFSHVYITFGLPSHRKFDDTTVHKEVALMQGNFFAVTSALRWVKPATWPDTSFVIVTTVSSHQADPGGVIYASAKAGLEALVRGLSREWVPARVNAIAPGPTATEQFLDNVPEPHKFFEAQRSPHGRLVAPEEVAQAAVELSRMTAVSGVSLPVDLAGLSSSRRSRDPSEV